MSGRIVGKDTLFPWIFKLRFQNRIGVPKDFDKVGPRMVGKR